MNYNDYRSQFGGAIEAIGGTLYDTATYTSAATVNMVFFTALRNNIALSNMELAGTLASPKAFLIRAIRVHPLLQPVNTARAATGAVNTGGLSNMALLLNTGVLTLTIGAKQYAQFPLWMLPSGSGVYSVMAADGNTADPGQIIDIGFNGVPEADNILALTKPIFIGPQINFNVVLNWPAAVTLVGGNPNIQVVFDGDLLRPIQ